jgi:hypothetical protein
MHIGLEAGCVKVDMNVDKSTLHFKHYDRSLLVLYVTGFYPQKWRCE